MIFYRVSELMLATLTQRYDKKSFHFKNERRTEILQAVRCHMIALIQYINLSNLSWIIKSFEEYGAFKASLTLRKGFVHQEIKLFFYSGVLCL